MTIVLVWFIDFLGLVFALKSLWIPACKKWNEDRQLKNEESEMKDADDRLEIEKKEMADAEQDLIAELQVVKDLEAAGDVSGAKAERKKFEKKQKSTDKERSELAEAK